MRGYRIGIARPLSPFGSRVRELLQERDFPVIELKLFEMGANPGSTLTEFQGEIVITQPLDPDLFPSLDLLFFGAEEGDELATSAAAAAREGVLTIVNGATDIEAPVMAVGINEKSISDLDRLVVAASAPSILIGTVLASLTRVSSIDHCCATVLVPACDGGKDAIEELHQQVVKILNFQEPPQSVFHEQIAFNVALQSGANATGPADRAVAREAGRLAGLVGPVSVSLVRVPVFHGYAAAIWVRFAESVEPEAILKVLKASRKITAAGSGKRPRPVPTPVRVADSDKIHVGPIRPDESVPEGFWFWVAADALALDPATHAVHIAEKALGVEKKR